MAEAMVKITGDSSGAVKALKSTSDEMNKTTVSSTKLSGSFGGASKMFSNFSASISKSLPQLSNLGGSLGSVAGSASALGGSMTSLAALANPVGASLAVAAGAVALFGAGLNETFKQLEKTKEGVAALDKMKKSSEGMKAALSSLTASLATGFGDGIDLTETLSGAMDRVRELFEKLTPLAKVLGTVLNTAFKGIVVVFNTIVGSLSVILEGFNKLVGLSSGVDTLRSSVDNLSASTEKASSATMNYNKALALMNGQLLSGASAALATEIEKTEGSIKEAEKAAKAFREELAGLGNTGIEAARRAQLTESIRLTELEIKLEKEKLANRRQLFNIENQIGKATSDYNKAVKEGNVEVQARLREELEGLFNIKESLKEASAEDLKRSFSAVSASGEIISEREKEIKKNKELTESLLNLYKANDIDGFNAALNSSEDALRIAAEQLAGLNAEQLIAAGLNEKAILDILNYRDANMNLSEVIDARREAEERLREAEEAGMMSTREKMELAKQEALQRMENANQIADNDRKIFEEAGLDIEDFKSSLTDLGLDALVDTFSMVGQSIGNLMAGIREDGANLGDMMKKMAGQVAVSLSSILMTTAAAQIAGGNFVGGAAMMAGGIALMAIGTALGAKKPKKEAAPPAPVQQRREQEKLETTEYIQRRSPSSSPQGTASGRNWGSEKDEADRYGIDRNRSFQG